MTMAGAPKDRLRGAWRWPVLALALLLAACQTSSGLDLLSRAAPVDNVPPAPPQPTVSEELFQPTVHAILAM
ncbi:MAG: hypothetical protein ACJ8EC_07310, partial [Microvirga sp.]